LQMLDDGLTPPAAAQPTPALPSVPDDEPGAVANEAPATTTAAATPAATANATATMSGDSLDGGDAAAAVSLRPSGMGADSAPTTQGGWASNGSKPATHEPPTALQKRQRSVREQLTFEEYEAQYGPAAK
jgi:hypothetical protein